MMKSFIDNSFFTKELCHGCSSYFAIILYPKKDIEYIIINKLIILFIGLACLKPEKKISIHF